MILKARASRGPFSLKRLGCLFCHPEPSLLALAKDLIIHRMGKLAPSTCTVSDAAIRIARIRMLKQLAVVRRIRGPSASLRSPQDDKKGFASPVTLVQARRLPPLSS
jgi:hypothetical protein